MPDRSMSKADVLMALRPKLRTAVIEDIHVFTVEEWGAGKDDILRALQERFCPDPVVVRSSSVAEDTGSDSRAGCFYSEVGVDPADVDSLSSAVEKVIGSYRNKAKISGSDQVIVQSQTRSVKASGVVFTRALGTNSPYYVINYDDVSGKTDTVTGGTAGRMTCVFRPAEITGNDRWAPLLETVKEVEAHFPEGPLDIEFAVTQEDKVVVFQVRPLAANRDIPAPDEGGMKELIESMKAKFRRFTRRVPHLSGRRTIFGDMPDWNPAEMIGSRPNTLDYTLYSFLITDSVWHEARSTLGYKDVYPGELMTSFGKRPYINTRLSFNSLVPAGVPRELADKLVDYYLDKLEKNPEKQDKVEFEIVWSCYNFSLDKELKELKDAGFSEKEINILKEQLAKLTNGIISDKDDIFGRDMKLVEHLTERKEAILASLDPEDDSPWTLFTVAYNLLQNCKKFGILPFSRLARLAFIGKSILMSLRAEGVISESSYHAFLNSIQTVASMYGNDLAELQAGGMSEEEFFSRYGHLRPGTYDITAPRYVDMGRELFKREISDTRKPKTRSMDPANAISVEDKDELCEFLRNAGDLKVGHGTLLGFISEAIRLREKAKLEFTRTLSEALEKIAEAGEKLGFSREDLSHVDVTTLMKFRNPEYYDDEHAKKVIERSRDRHRQDKERSDLLILPPVIMSEKDFDKVRFYRARPNFITDKALQAPVTVFDREEFLKAPDLKGRIVLLENADPGYDWIFTKEPAGIITKYGGVASHMAIRCAEFGIPAAIGCGDTIYEGLVRAKAVLLDCAKQVVEDIEV